MSNQGPANNESKDYTNDFDNSDLVTSQRSRDLGPAYAADSEIRAYKTYLETLEIEQRLRESVKTLKFTLEGVAADGTKTTKDHKIKLADLVPRSEFENTRRFVISKLVPMPQEEIKKLYSEFETDSMWTLSSKIANHVIDKSRRDKVASTFNFLT